MFRAGEGGLVAVAVVLGGVSIWGKVRVGEVEVRRRMTWEAVQMVSGGWVRGWCLPSSSTQVRRPEWSDNGDPASALWRFSPI